MTTRDNPAALDDEAATDAYDDAEDKRMGLRPCVWWVGGTQCPCDLDRGTCTCKGHGHMPVPSVLAGAAR